MQFSLSFCHEKYFKNQIMFPVKAEYGKQKIAFYWPREGVEHMFEVCSRSLQTKKKQQYLQNWPKFET